MELLKRWKKLVACASVIEHENINGGPNAGQRLLITPEMILWLDRLFMGCETDEEFEELLKNEEKYA